ncbi:MULTISPECIES: dioxygenase [unclassified Acidovorax]|uniref:dioxygenase family protein n=1 Tax=unclassified Acidovorax TaxID=2684926 RepID=UPI00070B8445|nr:MULTISPECIES: dioxygenase [unclassified Acidovorax]KRC21711.1 hydroxyquinol 1,2-dioxygenase [Acidovorax sp. Root219]KRC23650.1 hydroxyquinol 1,2-dioxygenase [Acidovorax sp. Root217]
MTPSNENELTQAVLQRLDGASDPRFAQIMESLVTHLHAFIREVDLKPEEWMQGIEFLTAVGKACTGQRQEFILLSDTLGASMMVVMLDQLRATAHAKGSQRMTEATEATVQGPYYWEGAPELPLGANLSAGVKGEPTFYSGRVTDTHGQPLAGALLDIWSGDGEGVYDMQVEGSGMAARARVRTDDQGRYWFWSIRPSFYPVPVDGPVGRMLDGMGRHPNRPGHIHMMVSATGHAPVTTHLFVAGSPYIESDAVFGVRPSLIVDFEQHPAGQAPDGTAQAAPWWSAHYDFRLEPQNA